MKWLFFSLLLVNLAFYLWATGHPEGESAVVASETPVVNSRSMLLISEIDTLAARDGGECLRIGPFLTQSTFADASRVLADMGLDFSRTAVSARKLQTWRAFVEVPGEADRLESLRARLTALDVDHYLEEENGSRILSVGVYSQSSDARQFAARLKEEGIDVTYRPELRTLGPLRWIVLESTPDRHAMEQLESASWSDAMARVAAYPCAS